MGPRPGVERGEDGQDPHQDSRWGQTNSYVSVGSMLAEADDRGEDEYYVEDVGWLTQDEFRALVADDRRIAPLCGPGTYAD